VNTANAPYAGSTQEYYLAEGLGSTAGITDGAGTVTGMYEYDAFGAERARTGATTEWSYTGEQNDPTGLEYLRARYYDAGTGLGDARVLSTSRAGVEGV
jgi:hypothetical protein